MPAEIPIGNTRGPHEIDQTVADMVPNTSFVFTEACSQNLLPAFGGEKLNKKSQFPDNERTPEAPMRLWSSFVLVYYFAKLASNKLRDGVDDILLQRQTKIYFSRGGSQRNAARLFSAVGVAKNRKK